MCTFAKLTRFVYYDWLMNIILTCFLSFYFSFSVDKDAENKSIVNSNSTLDEYISKNYSKLDYSSLNYEAYQDAIKGYLLLKHQSRLNNMKYLTIIDFSIPSNKKRLFLIDIDSMKVVKNTYCSHGKNSGGLNAKYFSNKVGSYKSSLGFYITDNSYKGKFEVALRLEGIESCNDNARKRAIVMHGAEYATEEFLNRNNGVLGRSFGCPAVPKDEAKQIISRIKNGSCLYIFSKRNDYRSVSEVLSKKSTEKILAIF